MNRAILMAAGVVLLACAAAAFFVWGGPEAGPSVDPQAAGANADDSGAGERPSLGEPVPPAQQAADTMLALDKPADRSAHLDWIGRQEWAKSNMAVLRTTIISDADEAVQIRAVETALTLAQKEAPGATSVVIRTSLASTKGNTRARGLKAARENPDPTLVSELITLVDEKDAYATMALNALAYTDSPDAHAKILAIAEDEGSDRKLRERAVALLAVTKDREALGLLYELRKGEDEALGKLADEVLRVLREDQ